MKPEHSVTMKVLFWAFKYVIKGNILKAKVFKNKPAKKKTNIYLTVHHIDAILLKRENSQHRKHIPKFTHAFLLPMTGCSSSYGEKKPPVSSIKESHSWFCALSLSEVVLSLILDYIYHTIIWFPCFILKISLVPSNRHKKYNQQNLY